VELYNFYALPNIIKVIKSRRMRWTGHVARMREMRNAQKLLVGKYEGTRARETLRRQWEDNIRKDLMEIGLLGVDWMHLAQDSERGGGLVNTVMNLRVP
jgi:superfamily II helicase